MGSAPHLSGQNSYASGQAACLPSVITGRQFYNLKQLFHLGTAWRQQDNTKKYLV
jgi:hypothetical protein